MDKVLSKNAKNSSSSIGGDKQEIGWKQDIVNNRATDILACKDSNGLNITEKENICKDKCKEVGDIGHSHRKITFKHFILVARP